MSPMTNDIRTLTLLNAGTKTRAAFMHGSGNVPVHAYKTKEILLRITNDTRVSFLYHGTPIDFSHTYVFTRLRATDAHFCGMLYEHFARHNIPANDPIHHSYPHSAEKISQMLLLAENGIRIPESFICREESFAANREYLKEHLSFPAVFKTDGSQGRNVHRIENWNELEAHMEKKRPYVLALIQPFIENTFDTRTLVAYDTVLGSISRTRTRGYLNNIAQGAIPARYTLTPEEVNIAQRAAHACRIDFAGVDMIHTSGGPIVLEVNKSPQITGFESVHEDKVFARIAEILRTKHSNDV